MDKIPRILAVEDDPDGQVMVAHILNYVGIPVDVAGDAEEAAEYLFHSDQIYRAAILDLALPGKDGWKLFRNFRERFPFLLHRISVFSRRTPRALTSFHPKNVWRHGSWHRYYRAAIAADHR